MTDVAPKGKTTPREMVAHCVSVVFDDTAGRGERANAYSIAKRVMKDANLKGSDLGNWIKDGDEGKYTEGEMQELAQAARADGVEAGIAIGLARANGNGSGNSNGPFTLPKPAEMAQYCHERLGRLKDDKQRDFVGDMYVITQRGMSLSRGRLGYLASIYIQIGGKV